MATLKQQVGNLVRHHRKRVGLTQAELAASLGMAEESINRIERGYTAPSFATLEVLSKALKAPVRDFFGVGEHEVEGERADGLVRLIGRLAGMDPDDIDWVDQLVAVALRRKVRAAAAAG